ncbi:MAG TPA: hypothetical protein VEJ68_01645 [Candidatus Bathyarchaeia archaeon]|nr:hypothetical protein [Candidatus Bathyarchaeia archaeon]
MDHTYYFDGNMKKISWMITTNETKVEQVRTHTENYYDKVSAEQSKYVSLHVGIFWSIGRFIIRNGDAVKVMVDQKLMFDHLTKNKKSDDPFIESRISFINQLIDQRGLDVQYQLIEPKNNLATKLLDS